MTSRPTRVSRFGARDRPACMCTRGGACTSFAPGHALHILQARRASASTDGWTDALVETSSLAAGTVYLRTLDGEVRTVWNAGSAALNAPPGAPVALHDDYRVLAIGHLLYNVASVS